MTKRAKYLAILTLTCALSAAACGSASATTMLGSLEFSGIPTNYYDTANGFVPPGYGNFAGQPVTVGGGVEFGFLDPIPNQYTADFTANSLTLQGIIDTTEFNAAQWQQSFTASTPGFFSGLSLTSDSFPDGVIYSLIDDTLTVVWDVPLETGGGPSGTYVAEFEFTGTTPLPAALPLFASGLGGLGLISWWRKKRTASAAV